MSALEKLDLKITPAHPGYRLMALLVDKVRNLAKEGKIDSIKDACDLMDITVSHFSLLRNGGADVTKLNSEKIESFSDFLGTPYIATLFLADQLSIEDFHRHKKGKAAKRETHSALDVIAEDETWGPMLPTSIYTASEELKLYTIHLYEKATGINLSKDWVVPEESNEDVIKRINIYLSPQHPGYRLMTLLVAQIHQLSKTQRLGSLKNVCDLIGITPSHFSLLCDGNADVTKLSSDKIENFAKFLDLPNISVRFLAGQISIEDFYLSNKSDEFSKHVNKALKEIYKDKDFSQQTPKSIYTAGQDLQLYTIRLYEEAKGMKLLEEGANLGSLVRHKPKNPTKK